MKKVTNTNTDRDILNDKVGKAMEKIIADKKQAQTSISQLHAINGKLAKITESIKRAQGMRKDNIIALINAIKELGADVKSEYGLSQRRSRVKAVELFGESDLDSHSRRALKIAKSLIVDGYKIRFDDISIAQSEKLIRLNKAEVNALYEKYEGLEYSEEVKSLIDKNSKLVTKEVKKFTPNK